MITDVPGILVGHWTDVAAETGCTVVIAPPSTVGSAEVRGGAPATRETDLLRPGMLVNWVDSHCPPRAHAAPNGAIANATDSKLQTINCEGVPWPSNHDRQPVARRLVEK